MHAAADVISQQQLQSAVVVIICARACVSRALPLR
jgi:hypothetical protein